MKTQIQYLLSAMAIVLAFQTLSANAAYEKSVMFSGKHAGTANAAAGIVQGPEALFFNPAGLAGRAGQGFTLNFSPTWSQFSGPIATSNQSIESNKVLLPIGSIFGSYSPNDRLGFGIGYYPSGGTIADYGYVDVSSASSSYTISPEIKTVLQATELSLGAGYEICEGLKIGAAWRMVFAKATFNFASFSSVSPFASAAIRMENLSDTKMNGFRLGVQYQSKDSTWGIGATWRSQMVFNASGDISAKLLAGGTALSTSTTATIGTRLPHQISVGGYYRLGDLRVLPEFTFSQYAANRTLDITAAVAGNSIGDLPMNTANMKNYRLGAEYLGVQAWAVRAGAVLTPQVVQSNRAAATFAAPGDGHSYNLGAGHALSENLELNGAVEYAYSNGQVTDEQAAQAAALGAFTKAGTYKNTAYALHLGLSYLF